MTHLSAGLMVVLECFEGLSCSCLAVGEISILSNLVQLYIQTSTEQASPKNPPENASRVPGVPSQQHSCIIDLQLISRSPMAQNEQKTTQALPAEEAAPAAPVVEESISPSEYYNQFKSQMCEWAKWASAQQKQLSGWDERWANKITNFKKEYIFSIGDLMNRSICMAIAGGLTYKLISIRKVSVVHRTRNLAVSFMLNGWLFVPELFNPYLYKID